MKDWRISSVLLTGLHHINEDTPGQDNLEIIRLENGFCAALADGVGSLAYSQIASMLATRTTVSWLADQAQTLLSLPDETARREYTARNLLEQIRTVLHQQAQRQQISIKKMDCNLAFCFLDAAAQTAIIGQLGDCAVCLLADDAGDAIRELADTIADSCRGTAAVFSGGDDRGYAYCLVTRQGDLRQFGKELTAALSGRGGGKPNCQQGRVQAQKAQIEAFFDTADE